MTAQKERTVRGVVIRAQRERALLSQEEFADRSGLSVRTVRNIETDRVARPHGETVRRIAAVLAASGTPLAQTDVAPGIGTTDPSSEPVPAVHQLPFTVVDFTGRQPETERLRTLLGSASGTAGGTARVAVVTGLARVGKTALVLQVAHQLCRHFPDGQLYVDLRGVKPDRLESVNVLGRFLRALNVTASLPEDVDERAALYRSVVAGRRILVVLDDVADEPQIRLLLPGGPGCAVLVISRLRLEALEGAYTVVLDVMNDCDAVQLLSRLVGEDRIGNDSHARQIATLCGRLPLALRIVGVRLASRPSWTTSHMADLLADESRRLDELAAGGMQIRTSFKLSYQRLDSTQRRALRLLRLLDAPYSTARVLAALFGEQESVQQVERVAEQLVNA